MFLFLWFLLLNANYGIAWTRKTTHGRKTNQEFVVVYLAARALCGEGFVGALFFFVLHQRVETIDVVSSPFKASLCRVTPCEI